MTDTCLYLARVGFGVLLGTPNYARDDADEETIEAARLADHGRVLDVLLDSEPESVGAYHGVRWLNRLIDWPDRVPGLKTWAGQSSLAKIIETRLEALTREARDLFEFRAPIKGASGLDYSAAAGSRDIGFSPAELGMPIHSRVAAELLAIVGLQSVPLVSFARRDCGFIHDGKLWRFAVEARGSSYHSRWGLMRTESLE